MSQLIRLAAGAAALLVAAACPPPICSGPADCDDGDPATADTCNTDGVCHHAPTCVGDACLTDPCSSRFPAAGGLKVAVLDVGQGDAIAVVAPSGCAALIDGGPTYSGTKIRSYLHQQGVSTLDFVVASHYHADHVGGLDELEKGADPVLVTKAYDRGQDLLPTDSSSYDQYAAAFGDRRATVSEGDSWTLCDEVCFKVVGANANGASTEDENARSVVLKLNYGAFTMLLGGDLTGDMESRVKAGIGEVDVYKVHHHGSAGSSTTSFLAGIKPSVSLISVGWDNTFGHPSVNAMARLRTVESGIWQTEEATQRALGPIEVDVTSATDYTVSQGTARVDYSVKAVP